MKAYIVCEKCGHRLGKNTPEVVCPLCKSGLKRVENHDDMLRDYFEYDRRGKWDCLRLPWLKNYGEIENNKDVENSGIKWTLEEAETLKEFFIEYGIADIETWKDIGENLFGRSLYSIEHVLRIVIAAERGYITLEENFEKV